MLTLKHIVGTIIISSDYFWDDIIKGGLTFSWLLLWVDLNICKGKLCVERRCEGKVALKAFWCFILCTSPGFPTIVVVLIVIVTQITLVILIIITITIIFIAFVIFFVLISFIPFIIFIIITSIIPYFFNIVQNQTLFLASTWRHQAIPTALIGDSDKVRIMMIIVIMISLIVIISMMSVMKMRMMTTIYILWCMCVTKNEHFLLGVSCNHLSPP